MKTNFKKIYLQLVLIFSIIIFFSLNSDKLYAEQRATFKRIYYFQHRLLPRWTHKSGGRFFNALMNDDFRIFNKVANKLLGTEYASKIKINKYKDMNAILITFPEPHKTPLCYYAFIIKMGEKYRYYTYEKTLNIVPGAVGMICEWIANGIHSSYGTRKYKDAESFIADLKKAIAR